MKHLLRNLCILIAVLIAVSVFLIPESHLNMYDSTVAMSSVAIPTEVPVEPVSAETTPEPVLLGDPLFLVVDSVGIYAPIESVGILGRAMAVPSSSESVGWYQLGVLPGEIGSAVLAGHVNWYGGKEAVFSKLKDVQIGDVITVIDSYGNTVSFAVREMRRYEVHEDARDVFVSYGEGAHLNLITCDGPWNALMGTHERRLVVFADKIDVSQ